MTAGHDHHDHHHHGDSRQRLLAILVLVLTYMVAEVVGGLISGSLALIADAGHMLSDAGALVVTLLALHIARRPASATHTFGYQRAEILGALVNGAALVAIAGYVLVGAYQRIAAPVEVAGVTMLAVAAGGLVVNLVSLRLLHGHADHSLNVRGAWLHIVADTVGSLGAVTAGALILGFGWHWADPLASVLIALLVLYSAYTLLRQTVDVLMQAVPREVDLPKLQAAIEGIDGVIGVHDLHVWSVTKARAVMSAHVQAEPCADRVTILAAIESEVCAPFRLDHLTVQIDCPEGCAPCKPPPKQNEGRRRAPLVSPG